MASWREDNFLKRFKESSDSSDLINKIATIVDELRSYGDPGFFGDDKGNKDVRFSTGSLDTYNIVWCIITPDVDLSRKVSSSSSSVDIAEEIVNLIVNRKEYCYILLWAPTPKRMVYYVRSDDDERAEALEDLGAENKFPRVLDKNIKKFNKLSGKLGGEDIYSGRNYILLDLSYPESVDDTYDFVVNHINDYNALIYTEFGKVVGLSSDWGIEPYSVEDILD